MIKNDNMTTSSMVEETVFTGRVQTEHEHGQQKRPVRERREKGRCERGKERRAERTGSQEKREDQDST